ncbi:O-antigen ligase family protein [Deinococcus koreensis]|uniref:O-antigen ligase-related domain-containing protein n=1 Tax=Deinococcus koreensis TaxID=2054903 RepID=A0A2K3UZ92_9DEIO|nr:O-antigen ligase family protein [Deinococcus koreensis]PNY81866.1 hypothetical protein CVO96_11205 [Deinococcus koreensis]
MTSGAPGHAQATAAGASLRSSSLLVLGPLLLTCLFLFSLSWENAVLVSGLGTVGRLLGGLAVLGWLLALLGRGRIAKLTTTLALMLAYLLYTAASYFVRLDLQSSFGTAITSLQLGVIVLLLWDQVRTRQHLIAALVSVVAGAYVGVVLTIVNFLGQQPVRFYERYSGGNFDPNDLGLILSLSVPLAWWTAKQVRLPALRWALLSYPLACLAPLVLTSSRAALIAYAFSLLYVLHDVWFTASFRPAARLGLLAALGLGVWTATQLAPDSVARLSTIGSELTSGNLNDRRDIWEAAWTLAGDSPILGLGVGRFADDLAPYFGQAIVAHNTLITVAVEEGVVGALLFSLYLISLLLGVLQMRGSLRPMWLACLACLAVGTFTLTWNHRKLTWVLPALALCSVRLSRPAALPGAWAGPAAPQHDPAKEGPA